MSLHLIDELPTRSEIPSGDEEARRVERTRRLFIRAQRFDDAAAREQLITQFMPLARKLAMRYRNSSQPLEDLVQVAHLGLVKAVDRFDPEREVRFSSFAVPTILGELRRHFRDTGWVVHVPRALKERTATLDQASARLGARTARAPSAAELAEHTGIPLEEVLETMEAASSYDALSLDAPSAATVEDQTLADTLPQEESGFELVEYESVISATMEVLSERERTVLALRFQEDLTQTEIAERVGISQMQVSRLLRRTMERLRTVAEARG